MSKLLGCLTQAVEFDNNTDVIELPEGTDVVLELCSAEHFIYRATLCDEEYDEDSRTAIVQQGQVWS